MQGRPPSGSKWSIWKWCDERSTAHIHKSTQYSRVIILYTRILQSWWLFITYTWRKTLYKSLSRVDIDMYIFALSKVHVHPVAVSQELLGLTLYRALIEILWNKKCHHYTGFIHILTDGFPELFQDFKQNFHDQTFREISVHSKFTWTATAWPQRIWSAWIASRLR